MDDRGSALPILLMVVIAGLLVLGLALDLGRWASTWREAAFAADAGATAGAAMIDEPDAYRGRLRVDRSRAGPVARDAAIAARPRPGRTVTVSASTSRVCVTVRQAFQPSLMRAAGIGDRTVRVRSCASPAQG